MQQKSFLVIAASDECYLNSLKLSNIWRCAVKLGFSISVDSSPKNSAGTVFCKASFLKKITHFFLSKLTIQDIFNINNLRIKLKLDWLTRRKLITTQFYLNK